MTMQAIQGINPNSVNMGKQVQKSAPTVLEQLQKEAKTSPIAIKNPSGELFVEQILNFKKNCVVIPEKITQTVDKQGMTVTHVEAKDKNGFVVDIVKRSKNGKLVEESFCDMINKATIKYNPETGKMLSIDAFSAYSTFHGTFDKNEVLNPDYIMLDVLKYAK